MYGVDTTVELIFTRCTKDQKFTLVRESYFCECHPDFWGGTSAGLKISGGG